MDVNEVEYALRTIRNIKGCRTFYDTHVHPFEVMDGPIPYVHSKPHHGLYSSVSTDYLLPRLSGLDLNKNIQQPSTGRDSQILKKVKQLNRRRLYSYTGSRVLYDHMDMSGVDRLVLLPVMINSQTAYQQLQQLCDMFGDDNRFILGYCVPNDIPNNEITDVVKRVAKECNVAVLKIHPSLQSLNPASIDGRERIESLLAAADEARLKVVIHGGLSPDCKDPAAIEFGAVNRLEHIDWAITSEKVVIAHAGCYGYAPGEVSGKVLPILKQLLAQHPNLMVDTSALHVNTLSLVFKAIDINRIYFGSDALYENQWAEMIKTWCALKQSVRDPEYSLVRIASQNPETIFFEQNKGMSESGLVGEQGKENANDFKSTMSF